MSQSCKCSHTSGRCLGASAASLQPTPSRALACKRLELGHWHTDHQTWYTALSTILRTSGLPSRVLVWPSNSGLGTCAHGCE